MFTIELSNGFRIVPEVFNFPGGEIGVRVDTQHVDPTQLPLGTKIYAHMTRSEDPVILMMLVDAMKRSGFKNISLKLYYVPYARQDRVGVPGESLSIHVLASNINQMEFNSVTILDPHSPVTTALFDRAHVIDKKTLISHMNLSIPWDKTTVVAPDAGAVKSAYDVAKTFRAADLIVANKVRDLATGEILRTDFHGEVEGKRLLLIDDICDGGRTFIELAKLIRPMNPARLELFVTHGIFSKGYDVMTEWFDRIYTTNSFHVNGRGNVRPDGEVDDKFFFYELYPQSGFKL